MSPDHIPNEPGDPWDGFSHLDPDRDGPEPDGHDPASADHPDWTTQAATERGWWTAQIAQLWETVNDLAHTLNHTHPDAVHPVWPVLQRRHAPATIRDPAAYHTELRSWRYGLDAVAAHGHHPPTPDAVPAGRPARHTDDLPWPASLDDADVAEAFATVITDRWLYCDALGGWLMWDGRRWARDVSEAVLEEARRFVIDIAARAARNSDIDAVKKAAQRLRAKGRIEAIATLARRIPGIAATDTEFDQRPGLLNCANGVVDLETGTIQPHDPDLRLTQVTETRWNPNARHDDIDTVLAALDPDPREWLLRLVGGSMWGRPSDDIITVLDGTGANGKTTVLELLLGALGDYAWPADIGLLMAEKQERTSVASLRGKRLVYLDETAEDGQLRMEAAKKLSGGSTLTTRFLYKDEFTFKATHTLLIATNHRPAVNASDYATWRRLRLVPMPHRYSNPGEAGHRPDVDRPKDKHLRARVRDGQAQHEAMLAVLVAAALRWNRDGLPPCLEIDEATEQWRQEEDVIRRFLADACALADDLQSTSSGLFAAYQEWCKGEGRPAGSNKTFVRRLEQHDIIAERGIEKRKSNGVQTWFGLAPLPAFAHRNDEF